MKLKITGLVILVIVCFLCIHAGYNHPSDALFTGLLWLIETEGITLNLDNLPLQFILVVGILITASLLEAKKIVVLGIILLIALLVYWIFLLSYFITFNYLSMIPFLLASCFGIWFTVKTSKQLHGKK